MLSRNDSLTQHAVPRGRAAVFGRRCIPGVTVAAVLLFSAVSVRAGNLAWLVPRVLKSPTTRWFMHKPTVDDIGFGISKGTGNRFHYVVHPEDTNGRIGAAGYKGVEWFEEPLPDRLKWVAVDDEYMVASVDFRVNASSTESLHNLHAALRKHGALTYLDHPMDDPLVVISHHVGRPALQFQRNGLRGMLSFSPTKENGRQAGWFTQIQTSTGSGWSGPRFDAEKELGLISMQPSAKWHNADTLDRLGVQLQLGLQPQATPLTVAKPRPISFVTYLGKPITDAMMGIESEVAGIIAKIAARREQKYQEFFARVRYEQWEWGGKKNWAWDQVTRWEKESDPFRDLSDQVDLLRRRSRYEFLHQRNLLPTETFQELMRGLDSGPR